MSDQETDAAPADSGASLATAMIVLTTLLLLGAVFVLDGVAGRYGHGMF